MAKKKSKNSAKTEDCVAAEAIPVEVGVRSSRSSMVFWITLFFGFAFPVTLALIANAWYSNDNKNINSTNHLSFAGKKNEEANYPERKLEGSWVEDWMQAPDYSKSKSNSNSVTHVMVHSNGAACDEKGALVEVTPELFERTYRWYNELGQVVTSPRQLPHNGTRIYRGPERPGTHFVWPCVLNSVRSVPGLPSNVKLTSLSSSPHVSHVSNFLTEQEMKELIDYSTSDRNPYRMARSTAGTHQSWDKDGGKDNILATRTSDNAFDIQTSNALQIKKRAFQLLRLHQYHENMADGIQVLRYQPTQAYISHHDYFSADQSTDFNWNPARGGSNRWATVFLYLSDVSEGGQTVFPRTNLDDTTSNHIHMNQYPLPSREDLLQNLKALNISPTSWEGQMVMGICHDPTKLSVQPKKGDALLFYSQTPDGHLDPTSLHGACPVLGLDEQKWGANLWVWNACRYSLCQNDPQWPADELPSPLKAPYA